MQNIKNMANLGALLAIFATTAGAQQAPATPRSWHADIWLSVSDWPAVGALEPAAGGSLDRTLIGVGGSWHFPYRSAGDGQLLLGVDANLQLTSGNVPGEVGGIDMTHVYGGGSAKWRPHVDSPLTLDAGVLAHYATIRDFPDEFVAYPVRGIWQGSTLGAFVGASWDAGRRPDNADWGLFVSARAHFVDFGHPSDTETPSILILGADAGPLDGPIYVLQIGVSWR